MKFVLLIHLVFLYGCGLHKINLPCIDSKDNYPIIKKEVLNKIDSFYQTEHEKEAYRIINSTCLNDSIIEIKIVNKHAVYDLYYFNQNGKLIKVLHELNDVY